MKRLLLGSVIGVICLVTMQSSIVGSAHSRPRHSRLSSCSTITPRFTISRPSIARMIALARTLQRGGTSIGASREQSRQLKRAMTSAQTTSTAQACGALPPVSTARQIDALENEPMVAYVEADGTMTAIAQTLPWGINRIDADISSTLAGNGSGAVSNVNAYIIDTGIATHADLNRVQHVNSAGGKNTDCNGHGTHVAGTVAAEDNTSDVSGSPRGRR